jgi:L-seryl-tRNA(Ser) seleniumtransferase
VERPATDPRLRAIPPAHAILASEEARSLEASLSRDALRGLVREVLESLRARVLDGSVDGDREALTRLAARELLVFARRARASRLRRVINATGVVLHTNLGRAPLGREVMARVTEASLGYAALEYDVARGERGHRDAVIAALAAEVFGAEDVVVVNNCAAAVLLAATALAAGREVIVSRGELVEIGGGFRIPEVIAACGAKLVEVGTTNRTRAADYERALNPATGAILKVHRSNFGLVGFTESATIESLVALGRNHGVPVIEDLGSGAMVGTERFGVAHEPTARESLAAGVDAVMVSGDKLLGGPQAGIIAGRREVMAKVRRHPLTRALRPGRLVLAALEATLRVYAEGRAHEAIPAVAMLSLTPEKLHARAERLADAVRARGSGLVVSVVATEGRAGGGTLPQAVLRSVAVRVAGIPATGFERALRSGDVPVVARIEDGAVLFDVRTIGEDELDEAARAIVAAAAGVTDTGHGRGEAIEAAPDTD